MQVDQPPEFMVFTGNANPSLAADIARYLKTELGAATVGRFSDGEVTVAKYLRADQRKPDGTADRG